MFRSEREGEILSLLSEKGYSTVQFLSETLGISQSSIRRDLALLEYKGLVSRSYGGVRLTDGAVGNVTFSARSNENKSEKKRMASAAISLVKEGNTVFVDSSGTASFLFPEIVKIKGITVVTNSIDGLHYLSGFGVRTISTGGMVSAENRSALVGPIAEMTVNSVFADITFISTETVSNDGTAYDGFSFEVPLRNEMMKNSRKTVLLCDGGAFGKTSVYRQCSVSDVDYVISGSETVRKLADLYADTVFITV